LSQSRDGWIKAYARRAEPPDLTKYTPRLAVIRKNPKKAVMDPVHSTEAFERMNLKGRA